MEKEHLLLVWFHHSTYQEFKKKIKFTTNTDFKSVL